MTRHKFRNHMSEFENKKKSFTLESLQIIVYIYEIKKTLRKLGKSKLPPEINFARGI